VLLREAETALARSQGVDNTPSSVVQAGAAFTAIIAAAGSNEAYLSELVAHLAEVGLIRPEERTALRSERHLWKKFNALAKMFAAQSDDLARRREYSQLRALVKLRNALIHRSAEFLPLNEWPDELADVRAEIPHVEGSALDWTSQVLAPVTAAWAVETARRFLVVIDEFVPDPARLPGVSRGGA
jgi:hypothetical protein